MRNNPPSLINKELVQEMIDKRKIDKRLQSAFDKAAKKKREKEGLKANANKAERDEHAKFIRKWMPKAKAWIDKSLFEQIANAESEGRHFILLGQYESGIPSEVIYEAAKKIKGLRPTAKTSFHDEYSFDHTITYSIEWDSTDPNDYRNDR